jgi:hypothetical protein
MVEPTPVGASWEEGPFTPANAPIGVGRGIHPGRVTWAHNPAATSWDGRRGYWWAEGSIDQGAVGEMLSHALRAQAGQPDDGAAWRALFEHFNLIPHSQTEKEQYDALLLGNVMHQMEGFSVGILFRMDESSPYTNVGNRFFYAGECISGCIRIGEMRKPGKGGIQEISIALCNLFHWVPGRIYGEKGAVPPVSAALFEKAVEIIHDF